MDDEQQTAYNESNTSVNPMVKCISKNVSQYN